MTEPTHLGADGRYNEDESPSPVHKKKQARTRFRGGVVEGGGGSDGSPADMVADGSLCRSSYSAVP